MTRRILALTGAFVLALIGVLIVTSYAAGSDRRALASLDPVQVVVATQTIPEGTSADALGELVTVQSVPGSAAGPGALTSLDAVTGLVTDSVLLPGEQLLETRFIDPAAAVDPTVVPVPAGMHEVSVLLDGPRALGGKVQAGDTVGIVVSLNTSEPHTKLTYHKILVTRVQGGLTAEPVPEAAPAEGGTEAVSATPQPDPLPGGSIMVSLALPPEHVEEVVFAAEYERIWLTREHADVPEGAEQTVTSGNLWEQHGDHTHEVPQ
jgi:pilus assembly protein CpaB